MFLAYRWLPEADGTTACQGSVSGLIGSVAAVYLLKMKPRGWLMWLGVTLAFAVGFLVFTHETWHRPPIYLLLGTFWGAGVGVAATLLYLRKLRGN
jgi:drug/metabolite transporter (DMT)-like permease